MRKSASSVASPRRVPTEAELGQFFAGVDSLLDAPRPPVIPVDVAELEEFFAAVGQAVEKAEDEQRLRDRSEASRFNVFDLIEPDENRLSDVIADLLDPKGNHGQGDLFLRLFFMELGIAAAPTAANRITVQREAATSGIAKYRRRIDVLVEADSLVVGIENKVDSLEQQDQVKDYLAHIRHCTRGRPVPGILVYLTPNGRLPESLSPAALREKRESGLLRCWSYQEELSRWLEACRERCEADKIRHFLSDFIAYIQTTLKREPELDEGDEADER